MKRIIHYLLYPFWKLWYLLEVFQIYASGDYLEMCRRTTWKYEDSGQD